MIPKRLVPRPPVIDGQKSEYKQPGNLTDRVTATEDLFVLVHMSVPDVPAEGWSLDITGLVDNPISITLDELRRLPKKTVEAVQKCASSPRNPTEPTRQVGNPEWSGVDLREVLDQAGVHRNASHLWAYGLDYGSFIGVEQEHYLKDIPRSRVDDGDVLIAYEVNGQPLSAKHGAPARLIVPGYYGTNSVKWLCRLELQDRRADSLFTRILYNDRDLESDPTGHTTRPVWKIEPESIIVSPATDDTLTAGKVEIWGWAWSHCAVRTVDVSVDGGRTWQVAALEPRLQYGWQRFRFEWTPVGRGPFEICCRTTDMTGASQPMEAARNMVHSITVTVA